MPRSFTHVLGCRAASVLVVLVAGGVAVASQDGPPREQGHFREADLVELVALDPTLHLDVRYATSNNLAGRPVYQEARAFLQRPAAEALVRVHRALKPSGYGLLVFDGYRPWSVTKLFWDVTPPEKREFVADPAVGSKHNRGCAVDLSLFDLRTNREVEMPGVYDEMSERSYPTYAGGTPDARARRDQLRAAMEAEGFTVNTSEWWHFDYTDWPQYRILDIPFSRIPVPASLRDEAASARQRLKPKLASSHLGLRLQKMTRDGRPCSC